MSQPASWSSSRALPAAATVPPITHMHRQLAVHPTSSGLVIRPYDPAARGRYHGSAVLIAWKKTVPQELKAWQEDPEGDELVVDGVAGLLEGFAGSYLLLIADSSHAATLPDPHSSKLRTVESIVAVPITSFDLARSVIAKHAAKQARHRKVVSSVESVLSAGRKEEDTDSDSSSDEDEEADAAPIAPPSSAKRPFWQRAFSRHRVATPAAAAAAAASGEPELASDLPSTASNETPPTDPNDARPADAADSATLPATVSEATNPEAVEDKAEIEASQKELDEKLVAETIRTFRGLYFSFETDVTRSLQSKASEQRTGAFDPLPLWRRADRRFWFNAHLMSPFVAAGLHSYIIVLQQGFARETTVPLPLQPYRTLSAGIDPDAPTSIDLTLVLISRRSIERPGLRYQRRGINSSGGVANFVETEFIVSCVRDGTKHHCSFVQVRGSIPAFWTQNNLWALKPPPVLERTEKETRDAMEKHIDGLEAKYGRLVLVNLAEQTGKEGAVVEAYRNGIKSLNKPEDDVRYVEWDFHRLTKGMHYERITDLIDNIRDDLEELRTYWATTDETYSLQTGVCRINCIDSLDRTNVVQSAISRWVLNRHLVHLGIASGETAGMHDELDVAFNVLWADNGDAISREYAGTSALKGDFTRTGKRNLLGAINDASNSIVRLGNSVVTDFFKQASLDYVLGVNRYAFEEFSERLETSDPRELLRLAQIRQEAIETSSREVLLEGEQKLGGWTMLSPNEIDTIRPGKGGKYEEKVLLVSNKATYVIQYEFTLQKVVSSVRIPTGSIVSLQTGAYILSSLDASTSNPVENYGLVIRYAASEATEKIRTYTLKTQSPSKDKGKDADTDAKGSRMSGMGLKPLRLPGSVPPSTPPSKVGAGSASAGVPTTVSNEETTHFIALKALRRDAIRVTSPMLGGQSQILDPARRDDLEPSRRSSQSGDYDAESSERGNKSAKDLVKGIVEVLKEEGEKVGLEVDGKWVVEKDIISVAESKAQTPLVDKLSRALYRAIWL
ncbi:hypothetical protein JCM10212_003651 [Sporobolomyces blumeae]